MSWPTGWTPPAAARAHSPVGDLWGGSRGPRGVYAIRPPNVFCHNVGLVQVEVTNLGLLGNPYQAARNFGWRGGEYLHIAGLWAGAIASDGLPHVSTASADAYDEFRPHLDALSTIYRPYEGALGGNRFGSGMSAAADGDGRVNEDFPNGLDDDGDGRVDEDFDAISQQMFACEYRDDTREALEQDPEHHPLNLLVRQRAFAWPEAGSNEFIGVEYVVTNVGAQHLRDVYLGFFVDADAGPPTNPTFYMDDLVGSVQIDTTLTDPVETGSCSSRPARFEVAYLYDAPDAGRYSSGDVPGFVGSALLGHTVDPHGVFAPVKAGLHALARFSSKEPFPLGDPNSNLQRYDLLSGAIVPEMQEPIAPHDNRWVMSAGPFLELPPDSSVVFQTCLVVGDGYKGMVRNAVEAYRVFLGEYVNADGDGEDRGTGGRETCVTALPDGMPFEWIDPCDPSAPPTRMVDLTCGPSSFVDADCDACTGVSGKETAVRWVGTVTLPAPQTNTGPGFRADPSLSPVGDREVVLQWDIASELRADPEMGGIIFGGYRLWRADGWTRPLGSNGPAPEDRQRMHEFSLDPKDGLGDASHPRALRYGIGGTAIPTTKGSRTAWCTSTTSPPSAASTSPSSAGSGSPTARGSTRSWTGSIPKPTTFLRPRRRRP